MRGLVTPLPRREMAKRLPAGFPNWSVSVVFRGGCIGRALMMWIMCAWASGANTDDRQEFMNPG